MKTMEQYIGKKKGVLTIVDIVKKDKNKKHTIVKCHCSRCGQYSETRLDRFSVKAKYAEHYCEHCRESYFLEQAEKKFLGRKNGVLTCTAIVGYRFDTLAHKRLYIKCTCSNCGKETIVRPERILSKKQIPLSCDNCYYSVLGAATHNRYYKKANSTSEIDYRKTQKNNMLLKKYQAGARHRNLDWELCDSDVFNLLNSPCYYCGEFPAYGIDRIDSDKGYLKENVVPCCGVCNIMKNKFKQLIFLDKIKKIYKHLHLGGSTTISKESTSQANGDGNGGYPEMDSDIV